MSSAIKSLKINFYLFFVCDCFQEGVDQERRGWKSNIGGVATLIHGHGGGSQGGVAGLEGVRRGGVGPPGVQKG